MKEEYWENEDEVIQPIKEDCFSSTGNFLDFISLDWISFSTRKASGTEDERSRQEIGTSTWASRVGSD